MLATAAATSSGTLCCCGTCCQCFNCCFNTASKVRVQWTLTLSCTDCNNCLVCLNEGAGNFDQILTKDDTADCDGACVWTGTFNGWAVSAEYNGPDIGVPANGNLWTITFSNPDCPGACPTEGFAGWELDPTNGDCCGVEWAGVIRGIDIDDWNNFNTECCNGNLPSGSGPIYGTATVHITVIDNNCCTDTDGNCIAGGATACDDNSCLDDPP